MGKCKQINNSNLQYVSDVISSIVNEMKLHDFANAKLPTLKSMFYAIIPTFVFFSLIYVTF